jgi:hypothetical protein
MYTTKKETTMKIYIKLLLLTIFMNGLGHSSKAQSSETSLLFGVVQPLVLGGVNVEFDYKTNDWVFAYSHGMNLTFKDEGIVGDAKDQKLEYFMPYTTGFGIGRRFTQSFDVRLEFKQHRFDLYYEGDSKTKGNRIITYETQTVGLGFYYTAHPFESFKNIAVASNFRVWPNIGSTLNNDEVEYFNKKTGKTETHKASNIGIANSPFILNMSIGYTF